jgi:outer membrane protein assembly factor BamB
VLPAGDWTGFRGPGGSAVSDEKGLPLKWGPGENLRYTIDLPGRGLSNPVIAAGRLYVTACSGYRQRRLHVLCYDPATGKKLWERQITATGSTTCNPVTCMAAPTPAGDAGGVYALFATADLVAYDRDGNLRWYRSLAGDYPGITNQVGMAASPALAGRTLLLPLENAGDSFAAGIDTATGKNRWKVKRLSDINWVSPVVLDAGGTKAGVFQTRQETTAYDADTGRVLWTYKDDGRGSILSPAAGAGLVFAPGEGSSALVALRPGQATTPQVVWQSPYLRASYSSPLYHKGRLYGLGGVAAVCLDAADGKVLWKQRLPGSYNTSPVLGDGKIYFVNADGVTTVLEAGDRAKVLATNRLYDKNKPDDRDKILATPAVSGGAIYLRSDRRLYCIGKK